MIITPEFSISRLMLTAYSYRFEEINAISSFLNEKEIPCTSRPLPRLDGRIGMKFLIVGIRYVQQFQKLLFINIRGEGKDVRVDFFNEEGSPFCCKKITQNQWERENETIYADGDQAALIKCALLANDRNWVGGVSEKGECKRY